MPDYTRPKEGFRFVLGGTNTKDTPDAIPPTKYSALQNVRSTASKQIRTRPGYVQVFRASNNTYVTDIRAYTGLMTDNLPRLLAHSADGTIWLDTSVQVGNLAGNGTFGASLLPFRPKESPQPWMYIGSFGDYQKFSAPDANNNVTQYKVGIAEPQQSLNAGPQPMLFKDFSNIGWNATGNASNLNSATRSSDTTGAVIPDPAVSTRQYVQFGNNANASYQMGEIVSFNNSANAVVMEVIPAVQGNLTIQAIRYASGNNGACVIVPSQMPMGALGNANPAIDILSSLQRGSLLRLGGNETVLVRDVIPGPNSLFAFETSTNNTWAANNSIAGLPSLAIDSANAVPSAVPIGANYITANFTAGLGMVTQNFSVPNPFVAPYTGSNNTFPQQDDYIHFSLNVSDPTQLIQILVMFNLDAQNFTDNVLYYAVRPSDFAAVLSGNDNNTVLSEILQAAENEIIGSLAPAGQGVPVQTSVGASQWLEVMLPVSSLTRLGNDQTRTLANCNAVRLQVNCQNNISVGWSSFWVGGGSGPDTGNNGAPYQYQAVPLSSVTGIRGNPTAVMYYGVEAVRQPILVKTSLLTAYDPQFDTWEVSRYGGSITSYRFLGTVPTGTDFIDTYFDDTAEAGAPVDNDNTEPWPAIDVPWKVTSSQATITAYGNQLVVSAYSAWPATIPNWLPGTVFQIGGQNAFTLRFRPSRLSSTSYLFIFEECIGSGVQSQVYVLEPDVAAQPLPYLWGPNEYGDVFGVGSFFRPGTVQWCKQYGPDAAPPYNTLELCAPSEPLLAGESIGVGVELVASSYRWWQLYFRPGQNGSSSYYQVEAKVGKRLASPLGKCVEGGKFYFWSTDGICVTDGGEAQSLTDADLYNLFPHGGTQGVNVIRNGVTFYAPNYALASLFRLAIREGLLYATYLDMNGVPQNLICNLADGAWSIDRYRDLMTTVYAIEQPRGTITSVPESLYPAVILGDQFGKVWKLQDFTNDGGNNNGAPIQGVGITFEYDGGDLRSNQQWGDLFVDGYFPNGASATPMSQSVPVGNATVIPASGNRQFVPVSLGGEELLNFVGLEMVWTDDFSKNSNPTTLYAWQPSYVDKPETTQDRFSDWEDFGATQYVRGVIIHADTFGANKTLVVRSDDGTAHNFAGGPAVGQINHSGEQEFTYYFTAPFATHMVRDEPRDLAPWRRFSFKYITDPWPPLKAIDSPWLNMGTPAAKWVQGAVIPLDTNGNNVTIGIQSSDGIGINISANTTPLEKTPVAFSWPPFIAHEIQLRPANNVRIWYDEIIWVFEPTPEVAKTWVTQWTACGQKGYFHIPRIEASYSSTAPVTLQLTSYDGTSPQTITLPSTGGVTQRLLVTFTLNKGTLYKFSATSTRGFQMFLDDWIVYVGAWERQAGYELYRNLGAEFGDKARI